MGLSYTEEIVSEYYKHRLGNSGVPEYFVSERVQFKSINSKAKVKGWTDIDILAIGSKEIHIVQTKAFAIFKANKAQSLIAIKQYFIDADHYVKSKYSISGKKIKWVFVADYGLSKDFEDQLLKLGIDPFRMEDIFCEFLRILKQAYPNLTNIGKEENNLTRTLIFMLYTFNKEIDSNKNQIAVIF